MSDRSATNELRKTLEDKNLDKKQEMQCRSWSNDRVKQWIAANKLDFLTQRYATFKPHLNPPTLLVLYQNTVDKH